MSRMHVFQTCGCVLLFLITAAVQASACDQDLYARGVEHFTNAQFKEAAQCFEKMVSDSNNKKGIKCLAFAVLLSGDARRAIETFTNAIRLDPTDPSLYYGRATANEWLGRDKDALSDIDQSIRLDASFPEALGMRKYLLVSTDDNRADEAATSVLEWELTSRKLQHERIREFLEVFENGDSSVKNEPALHERERENDLAWQRQFFLSHFAVFGSWRFIYERYRLLDGSRKNRVGNDQDTVENAASQRNEAITYAVQGNLEKAMESLNRAITLVPEDADGYSLRAALYGVKCEYRSAISDLTRALERHPNDNELRIRRAHLYLRLGDLDKAAEDNAQVLRRLLETLTEEAA